MSLTKILGAVAMASYISILGCTPSVNETLKITEELEFHLARPDGQSCSDCREVEYTNLLGNKMTILSEPSPSLTISPRDILSVLVVEREETGQKTAAFVPRDDVASDLREFINKAAADSVTRIVVMVGGLPIDVVRVDVLHAMHDGALVFAFFDEENFEAFIKKTTSLNDAARIVTDEEIWRACTKAAQGDEDLMRHCKRPQRTSPTVSLRTEGKL